MSRQDTPAKTVKQVNPLADAEKLPLNKVGTVPASDVKAAKLRQALLDDKEEGESDLLQAGEEAASGTETANMASDAPLHLAEAGAVVSDAPAAGAGSLPAGAGGTAAGTTAGTAAVAAGTTIGYGGLIALGVVGVAAAAASNSGSKDSTPAADTTPPAAPTFALAADTGASDNDDITSNGLINVSGLESGATWQYSTNGGGAWTTGTGTSFTLAAGTYAAGAVQVKQTDAAGNPGAATSSAGNITVDSTAPVIQSMAADSGTQTVVLTYDSPLDNANTPEIGKFTVTTGGAANPVQTVSVTGATVTITLQNAFAASVAVSVTYTDPVGNTTNAIQDLAGNDAVSFSTGVVADGYIRGATVYIDTNNNNQADPGIDYLVGTTNSNGGFVLPAGAPSGTIIATGGVNIDTGLANTIPLKAPAGSTVINPLTTLVQAVIEANPTISVTTASANVVSALGLTVGTNLATFDPLTSNDLAARKAVAAVAAVLTLAEDSTDGAAATVAENLAAQIQTASVGNTPIDLTDGATITTALTGSGATVLPATITSATSAITTAGDSDAIIAAQRQHLDSVPPDAPTSAPDLTAASDSGTSSTDNLTTDTTPTVRVNFDTLDADGTAAVAGDTITVLNGGNTVGTAVLTDTDITNHYKDITTSALLEGSHNLTATITDQATPVHTSTASAALVLTIDLTAPTLTITSDDPALNIGDTATITFTFTEDPGTTFAWDGTAGDVTVTGGTLGAISGSGLTRTATFTPDNGVAAGNASITVAAGSYTDAAGNTGGAGTTPVIAIDTLAPTVTIISDDAALNIGDTATITITFSEVPTGFAAGDITTTGGSLSGLTVNPNDAKVYTATFTPDNGVAAGTASITIAAGSYTDAAGNNGGAGTTPAITIDTLAPTVTITSDDGALNIGDTATITFTFSEDPGSSFTWDGTGGDVTVTGGTLGAISGSGLTRTATFTPTAGFEGNASITVAAGNYTDAAGNNGGAGTTPAVSIDTLAPTIAIVATASDNIINATEALSTVTVAGTTTGVSDGRTVTVHLNGHDYTTTVTANAWTATVPLIDVSALADKATYPVTADVSDAAGNAATQASQNVQVFTTGPAVTITPISGDNRINAQEHGAGITIAGTTSGAEDTSAVRVTLNGQNYDTTVTSNAWSVNVDATAVGNLLNGQGYPVAVSVTSASGPGSQSQTLNIDTTAPTLTITSDDAALNIGDTATITFTFTEDPGTTFTAGDVTVTGGTLGAISGSGLTRTATFTPDNGVAAGNASITVAADSYTDAAGNNGGAGATPVIAIDTLAPAAPIITGYTTDTGVQGDNITSNTQPTFSGTAAANATVNLSITKDGNAFATPTVTANAQGDWTFQPAGTLADGVYVMTATATDAAGNTGVASAASTLTIDHTAPAAPVTTGYSPDTGVQGDGITSNTQPTFSGTAEANATLNLTITKDGNPFAAPTVTANAQGAWSVQSPDPLADGVYALTATATDAAGNTGASSSVTTATVDHTAPTLVSFGTSTADGSYNAGDTIALTAIMSEAVRSGSTFVATLDGGGTATMTAAADGTTLTGSYVIGANQNSADLSVASYTAGSVQDLADNAMTATTLPTGANNLADGHAIVVDTISPSFTSAATASFANNGTGTVYTAAATDASNSVTYSLTGTDAGLFQIHGQTGVVTFLTAPSSVGTNNITVVATDLAGNATSLPVAVSVVNAPSLAASALDNVTNLDVTSNIVLQFSDSVTAVTGKYIHLVNDGGTGFHGENIINTQDILVTDTSRVTINGNTITINPLYDLDFNNNYHVEIEGGAFVNSADLGNAAVSDPTVVNFSTVNPVSATLVANQLASPATSQTMSDTGLLTNSITWVDLEGLGSPSSANGTGFDISTANIALVFKDYDQTTPSSGSFDGVGAPDFWAAITGFGNGDLLYIDNQVNNLPNDLNATSFLADTPVNGTTQLSFGTGTGGLGGLVDITVVGAASPSFDTVAALTTFLQLTYMPIVSA